MSLKNKRILITAGPTWVPIDKVRVISNIASAETGILLAEKLIKKQAKVTLILGPVGSPACRTGRRRLDKRIHLIKFRFFDELRTQLKKELITSSYDIIIHSAAVSDFRPQHAVKGKLKSGSCLSLRLVALPKLVTEIKQVSPKARLVMFKLESAVSDYELIRRSRKALYEKGADLVVANKIEPNYRAYILDKEKVYAKADSKKELTQRLTTVLGALWN